MKLHNKFEIVQNGKVLATAYNTMFSSVLDALENFEGFALFVAVGGKLGQTTSELSGTTLNNALAIFRASDVEYQTNPLVSTMFARRKITLEAGDLQGAEISSVGFCALPQDVQDDGTANKLSDVASPQLFNFAKITSASGAEATVFKGNSEIEIFSTIYLEWETNQGVLPLGGNNKFVKFLLGSNEYGGTAPTFDFGLGEDHRPNSSQVSQDYIFTKRYVTEGLSPTITKTSNSIEFQFSTSTNLDLLCCEIVLAANDDVVIRQNRDYFLTDQTGSETVVTNEYGVGTLQKYNAGDITRVVNKLTSEVLMSTPQELAVLQTEKHPATVSEPKTNVFDIDYDSTWEVFESKCGKMIAFVSSSAVNIYKNENGNVEKLDSAAIDSPQTITDIQFFDNQLFVVRSTSPYVEMFEWHSGALVKMTLRLAEAISDNMSGFAFTNANGQKISIGKDKKGRTTIAILFDSNNLGIFVMQNFGRICSCVGFLNPGLSSVGVFGALVSSGTEPGYVVVSGTDINSNTNVFTFLLESGLVSLASPTATSDFTSNVAEYRVGKNFIHIRRSAASYNVIWFFDGRQRRIKPTDVATDRYVVSGDGHFAMQCSTSSTNVYEVFIRENGAPISFLTVNGQTELATWQKVAAFGNAAVIIRSAAPHCLFVGFPQNGFTTVRGLPESATLTITSKLSLPQFDKENSKNYQMNLLVEIGGE